VLYYFLGYLEQKFILKPGMLSQKNLRTATEQLTSHRNLLQYCGKPSWTAVVIANTFSKKYSKNPDITIQCDTECISFLHGYQYSSQYLETLIQHQQEGHTAPSYQCAFVVNVLIANVMQHHITWKEYWLWSLRSCYSVHLKQKACHLAKIETKYLLLQR
jgi:hypothetical protein